MKYAFGKEIIMNKKELIDAMSEASGLTAKDAGKALDALISTIEDELAKGHEVNITGFGKFMVIDKAEKVGRNPQTGGQVIIPARRSPKFKAGKVLKDAIQ